MTCAAQVWFREGIHPRVPEGTSWEEVEVPKEVAQLSAGPGDLLWVLLWDGNLLVRTGLSLDSPTGPHHRGTHSIPESNRFFPPVLSFEKYHFKHFNTMNYVLEALLIIFPL